MCTTRRSCAFRASCLLLVGFLAIPASLFAQTDIPRLISYQGLLTDLSTGNPVANGDWTVTLRLYESAENGSPVWTETQEVETTNGVFDAILGSVEELSIPFTREYWLSLQVDPDPEMTERAKLTSAPYALGLSMPYADTVENSGTMLELYNEGLGGVGRFVVDNPASSSPALYLETNGTGLGLEVDGIIRADSVGFTSPLKRYASVHGSAFLPKNSLLGSWTRDESGFYYTGTGGAFAFAPIDIPDGAVIVDFSCRMFDLSNFDDLSCTLCQGANGYCQPLGVVHSQDNTFATVYSTAVYSPLPVNNAAANFFFEVHTLNGGWASDELIIVGAHVGYTVAGSP